jgi:hypothetical protein
LQTKQNSSAMSSGACLHLLPIALSFPSPYPSPVPTRRRRRRGRFRESPDRRRGTKNPRPPPRNPTRSPRRRRREGRIAANPSAIIEGRRAAGARVWGIGEGGWK